MPRSRRQAPSEPASEPAAQAAAEAAAQAALAGMTVRQDPLPGMMVRSGGLALAAAALPPGEAGDRPILTCIELRPDGSAAATDSYIGIVIGPDARPPDPAGEVILLPAVLAKQRVKKAIRTVVRTEADRTVLETENDDGTRVEASAPTIEGVFPEIRGQFSTYLETEPIAVVRLNPQLLAHLADVCADVTGDDGVWMEIRGATAPVIFLGRPAGEDTLNMVAVLQPMMALEPAKSDWLWRITRR